MNLKFKQNYLHILQSNQLLQPQCAYMKLNKNDRLEIAKMIKENIPE